MATEQQVAAKRLIAGAAHGAWIALLVGLIAVILGTVGRFVGMTWFPDHIALLWGVPIHEVPGIWLHFLGVWKMIALTFGLLGVMLSSWWRAL